MPKTSMISKDARTKVEHVAHRLSDRKTIPPSIVENLERRLVVKARMKNLEDEIKEIDETLKVMLPKYGGELENDDLKVSLVQSENRTINRELLIEHGVKPTTIEKATKVTEYSYVKVLAKGKK